MATHTAVRRSKHATLVASTVDTVPFSSKPKTVEVRNLDSTAVIFFRTDGTAPTVSGDDTDRLGMAGPRSGPSTATGPDLRVQTLTCALGTHTINVARATGTAYLFGICCRNSTVSRVYVQQCAHASGTAGTFATSFTNFNYTNIAADLDADLTIISIGINDWLAPTSQSTFSTNLQTLITNAKNTGDVIIATPFPTNVTGAGFTAPAATQDGLIEVMHSLATSNSVPLIDNFAMESSYTAGNQLLRRSASERARLQPFR